MNRAQVALKQQTNFSCICQVEYLLCRIWRPTEAITTMDQCYLLRNICQEYRPVKRRVTTACQNNFFISECLRIFHHVANAFSFKFFQSRYRWFSWFKGTQPTGDNNYFRTDDGTFIAFYFNASVFQFLYALHSHAYSKSGLEGCDLLNLILNQLLRYNRRETRNAVYGLMRINLRKLSSYLRKGINQVA